MQQAWLTAKWTILSAVFFLLGSVAYAGYLLESIEWKKPTPREWRFWTRQYLRMGRLEMTAVQNGTRPLVDWVRVGRRMKECLERLEDPEIEGQGLLEAGGDGEKILIADIGRSGFDISAKSYEWRTGYFESIMGCATAAEHLEHRVLDQTRGLVFRSEMVVGPSNPDPRPVPGNGSVAPPLEQNVVPAFERPEIFYMRVLTGKGFTTDQKLQAVEGYANWLDFKGSPGSAEEMYKWGIDIAKDAMPTPADVVLEATTNTLRQDAARDATPNLLRATTGLAVHYARTGNVSAALPILLSVLRARSNAPVSDFLFSTELNGQDQDSSAQSDIGQAISWTRRLFKPPQIAPPPPTGNTPLARPSAQPTCEEGELMLYIGEIVFANSQGQSNEGIGWTRQAVRVAEANIDMLRRRMVASQRSIDNLTPEEQKERKKCKECLVAGVQNWETMLEQSSARQGSVKNREGGRDAGLLEWKGWFGGDGGVKGAVIDQVEDVSRAEELRQVQVLRERVVREALEEEDPPPKSLFGFT